MVKVFFNNSCNICRAEINHYKKHSDSGVEWIDVTNNEAAQKITSKSYKELLRRMHVIQDGKVIDGAESFLIIWKNVCLLYTSPSPRDNRVSRMPSSA